MSIVRANNQAVLVQDPRLGAAELTARALLIRLVVFSALRTCSKLRVCRASNTLSSD